jgi:hypothetical protein
MPPVPVDPDKVHEFADAERFNAWLGAHHRTEREVWIKIHKVGSGLKSITAQEAIPVVLCWGWIDGIRKSFDAKSFLQRYSPRGPKSVWSRINVDHVARLIAEGLMTEYGLEAVEAAKADGRWDRAYEGSRTMQIPARSPGRDRRGARGRGDAGDAERAESLRPRFPRPQYEDRGRAAEEDRDLRRDAQARRDFLSAA